MNVNLHIDTRNNDIMQSTNLKTSNLYVFSLQNICNDLVY